MISVTLIVQLVTPASLITAILSPGFTEKTIDELLGIIGLVDTLATGAVPNWK
jgi:hypothetical protein